MVYSAEEVQIKTKKIKRRVFLYNTDLCILEYRTKRHVDKQIQTCSKQIAREKEKVDKTIIHNYYLRTCALTQNMLVITYPPLH